MKLSTHYVEKPWGRTDLPAAFSGAKGRRIGEVWFDAPDHKLPILVKWLFTSAKLSIQVHPNDQQAKARGLQSGKEECWVIVEAEPDAQLGIGTVRPLDADQLLAASLNGEIEALMDWRPVKAGDYFYIPAGTVHAIGAGITLVEVQQNADITYRLYDYGRPRELHLDDGVAVSDAKPYSDIRSGEVSPADVDHLVSGPHFDLWHARGPAIADIASGRQNVWVMPLTGSVHVLGNAALAGDCFYLGNTEDIAAGEDATALIAASHFAEGAK